MYKLFSNSANLEYIRLGSSQSPWILVIYQNNDSMIIGASPIFAMIISWDINVFLLIMRETIEAKGLKIFWVIPFIKTWFPSFYSII